MSIKLVTAATGLPVGLDAFKDHIREDSASSAADADLTLKLKAACRAIERAIGYPILHSTWDLYSDEWPCVLPHHQVSSVTSVKYTAVGSSQATVDSSVYSTVGLYDETDAVAGDYVGEARIVLACGQYWPTVTLDVGEPIVTRIVSGWKAAQYVPEDLKIAILLEAAHIYRNRESVTLGNTAIASTALARGVDHFIAPYVRWKF